MSSGEGSLQRSTARAALWFAALTLLFVTWITFDFFGKRATRSFDNVVVTLAYLMSGAACLRVSRRSGGRWPPWRWFGTGLLSWGAGNLVWTLYELAGRTTPFPSAADIGYLAMIPCAVAGILHLNRSASWTTRSRALLDGLTAGFALLSISLTTIMDSVADERQGGLLAVGVSLAYPFGDVLILALILSLAGRFDLSGRARLLLVAGFGLFAVSDSSFAYLVALGRYETGSWIDVGWLVAPLTIALAGLCTRSDSWVPSGRRAVMRLGPVLLVAAAAAVFMARELFWDGVPAAAWIVAALLIPTFIARQVLADRESDRLLTRIADERRIRDAIFDLSLDPIVVFAPSGIVRSLNAAAVTTFGYSADGAVGRSVADLFIPPNSPERARFAGDFSAEALLQAGYIGNRRLVAGMTSDGRTIPCELAVQAVETPAEPLIIAFVRNVSERVQAETRLRESEIRYHALFAAATDIGLVTDREGTVREVNAAFERITGRPNPGVVGSALADLVTPVSRPRVAAAFRWAEGVAANAPFEIEFLGATGDPIPVETTVTFLRLQDTWVVKVLGRDLRDRRRLEQARREAGDQRTALLVKLLGTQEIERARISNDVHEDALQAIAGIGLRLDTMARKTHDPGRAQQLRALAATAQRAIERLRSLLFELRPRALDQEGLASVLEQYADHLTREGRLAVTCHVSLGSEPASEIRLVVYRIIQEAVSRLAQRSPGAAVAIGVTSEKTGLGLTITTREVATDLWSDGAGGNTELATIAERAQLAGGSCTVSSDEGCSRLHAYFPADVAVA